MNFDAVIKIGGSLSYHEAGLADVCREISRLCERHSLLIVPGGAEFANQVRNAYKRYNLGETETHYMALLAMDQYGYVLSKLIDDSLAIADLHSACRRAESGRAAVFLPSAMVIREDPLPHSWRVTSDTIAAWVALKSSCRRVILLKDVDGVLSVENNKRLLPGLLTEMTVKQMSEHAGCVDEYLAHFLASVRVETWVINGLHPERLSQLLDTNHTLGTRIRGQATQ
jgi:aspartokinase-like uncharacterized kinase